MYGRQAGYGRDDYSLVGWHINTRTPPTETIKLVPGWRRLNGGATASPFSLPVLIHITFHRHLPLHLIQVRPSTLPPCIDLLIIIMPLSNLSTLLNYCVVLGFFWCFCTYYCAAIVLSFLGNPGQWMWLEEFFFLLTL